MIYGLLFVIVIGLGIWIHKKMSEGRQAAYRNQVQHQVIEQQKTAIQSIRKKQHEYKNTINNLYALLFVYDVESARNYMKEVLNESAFVDQMIRQNGSFVGLLLEYKIQEARRKGIRVEQDLIQCYDIPISEYDIAVVINNAMNNAMEACEKLPERERYIRCKVNMKMHYLNFSFENPCAGDVCTKVGKLVTSKANKSEHGFGMGNIKDIATKYDGFINHGVSDGVFWLRCSLNLRMPKSA